MSGHDDVVVMNTDAQSLLSSIVAKKVPLGQKTTYGLGAGGDPEVGLEAAQESRNDIRSAMEGAKIVFLCAGLGGGRRPERFRFWHRPRAKPARLFSRS